MLTSRTILVVALAGAIACGRSDSDVGGPADADEAVGNTSLPIADVALSFDGAFSASLEGKAGTCSLRRSGPMPGATWRVHSDDLGVAPSFELTIIAEADAFDDPSVVVNVVGTERVSYARRRGQPVESVTLARDGTSAQLDLRLTPVAATGEALHVKGTLGCVTPLVSG